MAIRKSSFKFPVSSFQRLVDFILTGNQKLETGNWSKPDAD
jgi:hypothetical protein